MNCDTYFSCILISVVPKTSLVILVMLIDSCCLLGINRLSMEKTTTLPVRPHSPSLSSRNDNLVTTFHGELWIWILEFAFLLFSRERVSDLML